jgi:hypothetical protein
MDVRVVATKPFEGQKPVSLGRASSAPSCRSAAPPQRSIGVPALSWPWHGAALGYRSRLVRRASDLAGTAARREGDQGLITNS